MLCIDSKNHPQRLYIIVRADLPPGAMAAQSCHAMRLWSHEHQDLDRDWYHESNNLVLCEAPDEAALLALAAKAKAKGHACSVFREPDYDDTATAITIEPAGWRLCSSLPLAMRKSTADPKHLPHRWREQAIDLHPDDYCRERSILNRCAEELTAVLT